MNEKVIHIQDVKEISVLLLIIRKPSKKLPDAINVNLDVCISNVIGL